MHFSLQRNKDRNLFLAMFRTANIPLILRTSFSKMGGGRKSGLIMHFLKKTACCSKNYAYIATERNIPFNFKIFSAMDEVFEERLLDFLVKQFKQ